MATLPHWLLDFRRRSRAACNLFEEIQGQGIVFENITPGQCIIFGILTPGQAAFSDFSAAPPRMFEEQAPPPRFSTLVLFDFSDGLKLHCARKGP